MTDKTETILLEIDGPQATITLNRPEKHNALQADDMQAIIAALQQVSTTPEVRVLVITGRGEKTFCAGASLKQLGSGQFQSNLYETMTNRLEAMKIPTICALNGSVYGGGAELALCCDFRMGVKGSRMFVPAARLGLCYPITGLKRYVNRLGHGPAKRILVAGETLPAQEMHRLGFLDYLVQRSELEARCDELAQQIAGLAPLAVQAMKYLVDQTANGTLNEAEATALRQTTLDSQDLQEGLLAQSEKRRPVFQGR